MMKLPDSVLEFSHPWGHGLQVATPNKILRYYDICNVPLWRTREVSMQKWLIIQINRSLTKRKKICVSFETQNPAESLLISQTHHKVPIMKFLNEIVNCLIIDLQYRNLMYLT